MEREMHLQEPRPQEEGKSSSSGGVSNLPLSGGLGESSSRDVPAFDDDEYLERPPRKSRSKTLSNLTKKVFELERDMYLVKPQKLSKRFHKLPSDIGKVSLQIFELEPESEELSHEDGWGVSNFPSSEGDMQAVYDQPSSGARFDLLACEVSEDETRSALTQAACDVEICDEKEKSESPKAMLVSEVSNDETRSSPTQADCDMEICDEEKEKSESPSDHESLKSSDSEFEYKLTEEEEEEEEETPVEETEYEGYARAEKVYQCLNPIYACMKRFADHSAKGLAFFHALISAAVRAGILFDKEDYYCFGMSAEMDEQMKDLWREILDKTKGVLDKTNGGSSLLPFFNLIVDGKIDFGKYPLVGEYDLAYMLVTFWVLSPHAVPFHSQDLVNYCLIKEKVEIYSDIADTICHALKNKLIPVVDFKKLLPNIMDGDTITTQEMCLIDISEKFVTEALHEIEEKELSKFFCNYAIESSKEHLLSLVRGLIWDEVISKRRLFMAGVELVVKPFTSLLDAFDFCSSDEVKCLIKLAECCRKAESARFIRREHFVWAFQEKIFVLPSWMKLEGGSSNADGASPPYHIYATSIMLAKYLGDNCVEVEHLAYASIFGKHMEFESEQLKSLARHYKEICSKGFERVTNIRSVYEDPSCEPVPKV